MKPSTFVIPTEPHDYPEWRKGRNHYSLWYIEITHPQLVDYLTQLRQSFSRFLYTPNTRQFHITLWVCGFLTDNSALWDDDFPTEQIASHKTSLNALSLKPFTLRVGKINSFDAALIVEIKDPSQTLLRIRSALSEVHQEIAALTYCPHITLGLYKEAYSSEEIFTQIQTHSPKYFDILINEFQFGYFDAKVIQGPLIHTLHHSLVGQ